MTPDLIRLAREAEVRERPILFSGAMVRAILAGRKSQTRRVVKDQTMGDKYSSTCDDGRVLLEWLGTPCCGTGVWDVPEHSAKVASPYGLIGDRLWVRETSAAIEQPDGLDGVRYSADSEFRPIESTSEAADRWLAMNHYGGKRSATVPAIHMPRWASRITLEITGVRVERLQDISEADAIAEGIDAEDAKLTLSTIGAREISGPVAEYSVLWESINGPGSWDANPWVWVVEFQAIRGKFSGKG